MQTRSLLPRRLLNGGLAISMIALAGCDGAGLNYLDPYKKPYAWHPTGAPAANIAAQVVDPRDLVTGRGTNIKDTQESTVAIQHIWTDTPKSISTESGGGGSAAGPGASGAGPGASGGSAGGGSGGSGGSN